MDIFNGEDRRTILDVLRRSDFSDAERVFATIIAAAHGQGKVDGANEMGMHMLAKMDEQLKPQADNPAPQLEDEMRRMVVAKFRHRGEEPA